MSEHTRIPDPEHCPDPSVHGNPFRYCPYCTWIEEAEPATPSGLDPETITLPIQIETADEFAAFAERGIASLYLVKIKGDVALAWEDEDGSWHGIRPVTEDDGDWNGLSNAVRTTLAVQLTSLPSRDDDYESFTPLTVLWHDAQRPDRPSEAARLRSGIEALADEWERARVSLLAGGVGEGLLSFRDAAARLRALLSADDEAVE